MRWREGQVVATHYRLIRCTTEDAHVSVWTAEDRSTKRPLTVRLWKSPLRPAVLKQVKDEVRGRASVVHPALVKTVGVIEEGMGTGVVLEHVPGLTLEARLKASPPLGLEASVAIMRSVALGLDAAHAKQILHRDLSPAGILLPSSGEGDQPAARLTGFLFAADRAEGGSVLEDARALGAIALAMVSAARPELAERLTPRIAEAQTPQGVLLAVQELVADPTTPTPVALAPPPAPSRAAGLLDDLPTAPGRPSLIDDLITKRDTPALEADLPLVPPRAPAIEAESLPALALDPGASPRAPAPPAVTPPSARFVPGMLAINRLSVKDRAAAAPPRLVDAWRGLAVLLGLSLVVILGLAVDAGKLVPALLRAGAVLSLSALAGTSLIVAADRKIRVAVEALLAARPPLIFKAVSADRRALSASLLERGPSQAILARTTLRFLTGPRAGLRGRSQPLRLELKLSSAASAMLLPDGTWRRFPLRTAIDSTVIALGSSQDAAAAVRRALTVLERAGAQAETNGSHLAMTVRVPARSGADLAKSAEAALVAFAIAAGLLAEEDRRLG
jgi:serine/threonine protein kinase